MLLLLSVLASAQVPAHVAAARDQVDWDLAGAEAAEVLAGYLAVDTVNPPGNELRGVEYLGSVLDEAGIAWQSWELEASRASLVARLDGGDAPPLCLLSHIDVVPAEEEHWEQGPLSGMIDDDGWIWGRGALDMKGMGVLQLETLVWLHRLEVPLDRDVVLIAVADEEVDNRGIQRVVARWDEIGCSHVLNEGGIGVQDVLFEGQALHTISVAEKGTLWVDMVATGQPGHGSTPRGDIEAPARLLAAMKALDRRKPKPRIDPVMYELLDRAGRHKGGISGAILRSRGLVDLLVKGKLMSGDATRAAITDTVHLTGVRGAVSPNTVPSEVRATYDCRLLADTQPEALLAELERRTRRIDGIRFEVVHAHASNRSPIDDPLFETIAKYAVEGRPDAVAVPLLSIGFTDSIYLRPEGVHAYGYLPFEIDAAGLASMHGHNERVHADNVREGLRRLFSMVVDFAGSAD